MEGISVFKKKFTKGKVYTSICAAILLTMSLPIVSRAGTGNDNAESADKSNLYIQLLDYAMPFVQYHNPSEDENSENQYSIKEKLLEFVGLDIKNPLSIVDREFNLITNTNPQLAQQTIDKPFIINPFRLNENSIIKNPAETPPKEVTMPIINTGQVYNPKIKKTLNPAKPEVLIYHSHTTESYAPNAKYTDDASQNMCAVGDVIKNDLEKNYGVSVIHDKTIHNIVMNKSYTRSAETVDKYLNKYKDFKLIIDLHRDSVSDKSVMTASMNDSKLARYMFVLGPGNPNKAKNLEIMKKMASISQTIFPGLLRNGNSGETGIYFHKPYNKFNQQKNSHMVLIEVGSQVNTIDEAKTTGVYLSRIIAEYLNQTSK